MPFKDKEKARKKNAEYQKKWFQNNKETQYRRVKERVDRNRRWLADYKKTQECQQCGEDHPACLDFHHRDQKQKNFGIAQMHDKGLKTIKAEIAKCIVLCSNCHRKKHWQDKTGPYKNRIEGE